ncbi:hypothetical protein DAEQUDRAFT_722986 [Daedalea quercina L-15889]|uniref:F-box domain-containing protein n=1 Tax=Daedalea quercina L-15889 TaxID=1314783 RepID=A0A165SPS6_9APHY|nr:hypothetical protein DAEQUDRAFT_722986 [Daedalea quercina L-15889]
MDIYICRHTDPEEEEEEEEEQAPALIAACFRHLRVFHNLRRLTLMTDSCIVLDDEILEELAMSWPRLEHLQLSSSAEYPWMTSTATTLEGLAHLARYCPSLSFLAIDVDTSHADVSPHSKPGGGYCNRALWAIEFGQSRAEGNPAKIAAFLFAIFPNLRWIAHTRAGET